jgi:NitT/TauT family transport system substrate-binding protein
MKFRRFAWLLGAVLMSATNAGAETLAVRVGVIPVMGASPLFVANGEGWLREAGLDLSIKTFESGPNIIQAAASGGIDLYVAGVAPLALGRAKGIDFRVVAASAIDENVLVAGPKLNPYFKGGAKAAAAFQKFHVDTGRPAKIATQPPGSVPAANLQYWLREVAHVDPSDIQIVSMGIDATQQAVLAGAVEAAIVREPTLTIVQQRNPDIALIASGEDLFPGQPGTVVAAFGPFLKDHPQAVQAIVDGVVRAIAELQKTPDQAVPHIEAVLSKGLVKTATIRKALSSPAVHFVADPKAIMVSTRSLLAYQVKLGALTTAPTLDGLFDPRFYDESIKHGAQSQNAVAPIEK